MLVFCVLAVPRGMWDLNIFQPGIKSEPCEVKDWSLNPWPPASPAYASFVRNCQAVFYTGCILTNNASSCSSAFSLAFGGVTFAYFQIGLFKKLSCLLYTLDRSPLWNRWFANILPLVVSCFRDFFFPHRLYFWLRWVFIAACELSSRCGTWASHITGFSCSRAQALAVQASAVVAPRC